MDLRRDLTGTTIAGRYRVVRRLGVGGMGAVWLVQHLESLQHYALKTLHEHATGDRMAVERFLREARAAAALRSKHVVKVVDAQMNHVDATTNLPMPFLVMELLEGSNLEQLIANRTRLPPEEVVWILKQVARALDTAHEKGIVHRDLKPENIYLSVDEDGEVVTKVCDFGIAKLGGEAATGLLSTGALGTQTGSTLGTPMYMSPEQARSSADVTAASDQWALGLIAFKALTGREYFSTARSTTELLLKIVNDPLEPPTSRLSSLPNEFDVWFYRSCARDPNARWSSAGEQIGALTQVLGVTQPVAPKIVTPSISLAVAETISADSPRAQVPDVAVHPTTASPVSASPAPTPPAHVAPESQSITEPLPKKRTPLFVALGLAAALVIGGTLVFVTQREPSRDAAAAPSKETKETKEPKPKETASAKEAPTSAETTAPKEPTPPVASTIAKTAPTPIATVPGKLLKPPVSATASVASKPPPPTGKLPKGASCTRSAECASGFCVSEECQ